MLGSVLKITILNSFSGNLEFSAWSPLLKITAFPDVVCWLFPAASGGTASIHDMGTSEGVVGSRGLSGLAVAEPLP